MARAARNGSALLLVLVLTALGCGSPRSATPPGSTVQSTVSADREGDQVIDQILARLPDDSRVSSATLDAPPTSYAENGATGSWLTIRTSEAPDNSADWIRGQWESWLVEGAYADLAPQAGADPADGATYVSGVPPAVEDEHRENNLWPVSPAQGAQMDDIESSAATDAGRMGLLNVTLATETLDQGTALIITGVASNPASFLTDHPNPVSEILRDDRWSMDGVLLMVLDEDGKAIAANGYATRVGGQTKWIDPAYRAVSGYYGQAIGGGVGGG